MGSLVYTLVFSELLFCLLFILQALRFVHMIMSLWCSMYIASYYTPTHDPFSFDFHIFVVAHWLLSQVLWPVLGQMNEQCNILCGWMHWHIVSGMFAIFGAWSWLLHYQTLAGIIYPSGINQTEALVRFENPLAQYVFTQVEYHVDIACSKINDHCRCYFHQESTANRSGVCVALVAKNNKANWNEMAS